MMMMTTSTDAPVMGSTDAPAAVTEPVVPRDVSLVDRLLRWRHCGLCLRCWLWSIFTDQEQVNSEGLRDNQVKGIMLCGNLAFLLVWFQVGEHLMSWEL